MPAGCSGRTTGSEGRELAGEREAPGAGCDRCGLARLRGWRDRRICVAASCHRRARRCVPRRRRSTLAIRVRRRALSNRIYTGNASDWMPPRRFTYVRTGLEYVPAGREPALVARLLRDVVEPGGRLIADPVAGDQLPATLGAFTAAGAPDPQVVPVRIAAGRRALRCGSTMAESFRRRQCRT
jgi:hypothetical protein